MTRPLTRGAASLAVGALLTSAALTALAPQLVAVASYDAAPVAVPGVDVLTPLPALQGAVVRGDAAALARLAAAPGVRGLALDTPVELAGRDDDSRDEGVLASEGLGGRAGRSGAGAGVRVALVDTGVSDSDALSRSSGRLVDAVDTSRVAEGGGVRTSGRFTDGHGHGTFMASLIAGDDVDGSRGRAVGVAPGATVLVVRVADPDGTTSLSQVVAGLDWIAAHPGQVDVANLSFSQRKPGRSYGADPLTDAVERVRRSGTTMVVSAGNRRGVVGDPGFDPRVLTVGAADLTGERVGVASFSGSDVVAGVRKPDVVASGVDVLGVLPRGSVVARSYPGSHQVGALWRGDGTSQATAITTGVAALLLQEHPQATPAQVKASIRQAAVPLRGQRDGAGLVQLTDALVSGPDGTAPGSGEDLTGEGGFDAGSWSAGSWSAGSWSAGTWSAGTWSAGTWSAGTWSAGTWSAGSWSLSAAADDGDDS